MYNIKPEKGREDDSVTQSLYRKLGSAGQSMNTGASERSPKTHSSPTQ